MSSGALAYRQQQSVQDWDEEVWTLGACVEGGSDEEGGDEEGGDGGERRRQGDVDVGQLYLCPTASLEHPDRHFQPFMVIGAARRAGDGAQWVMREGSLVCDDARAISELQGHACDPSTRELYLAVPADDVHHISEDGTGTYTPIWVNANWLLDIERFRTATARRHQRLARQMQRQERREKRKKWLANTAATLAAASGGGGGGGDGGGGGGGDGSSKETGSGGSDDGEPSSKRRRENEASPASVSVTSVTT